MGRHGPGTKREPRPQGQVTKHNMKVAVVVLVVVAAVFETGECSMMGRGLSFGGRGGSGGGSGSLGRRGRPGYDDYDDDAGWSPTSPREPPCVGICYMLKLQRLAELEKSMKSKRYDGYLYDFYKRNSNDKRFDGYLYDFAK